MKKALPTLITLLAVAAGGAAVYMYQKPGLGAGAARPMAADYLPADTLLLLSLPNPAETASDWKTTDLYKIWTEPEVQAFLEKPLAQVPQSKEFNDTLARVVKLDPKNLFVALTSLEEKTNQPHALAGFQFKGSTTEVEQLLAQPKEMLRKSQPGGKADLLNYQGQSIETYTANGDTLASVFLNNWYLISNDLALLKTTIDRIEHRAPANLVALAKDADFEAVCAKLPSGSETMIFARAQPFLSRIYAFAAASGQSVSAEQRAEAEKIKAIGAATQIDKGLIRDTIYYLAPDLKQDLAKLQMDSLPLTSADTLFYGASMLNIPDKFNLPSGAAGNPALAVLDGFFQELSKQGITLESFRAAFGNEAGAQLDWAANSSQPAFVASLTVRDRLAANELLGKLVSVPTGEAASWRKTQNGGQDYYTLTLPNVPFLSPTLTLDDKHLILALNAPDARAAVTRDQAGGGAVAQKENYKSAAASVNKPNVSFAYLDAKGFFERLYGSLRPAIIMSAAFLAPQAGDYVDLGKLPNTEPIAKHLSPIVFSQNMDSQGVTFESVGTVTFAQAIIGVAGGAGAAAVPILQKQYGLGSGPAASDTPSDDASPSPAPSAKPGKNE